MLKKLVALLLALLLCTSLLPGQTHADAPLDTPAPSAPVEPVEPEPPVEPTEPETPDDPDGSEYPVMPASTDEPPIQDENMNRG